MDRNGRLYPTWESINLFVLTHILWSMHPFISLVYGYIVVVSYRTSSATKYANKPTRLTLGCRASKFSRLDPTVDNLINFAWNNGVLAKTSHATLFCVSLRGLFFLNFALG